jgi:hypothetical protein
MLRRRPVTPANDAVAVVPVFTTDPHGAALFHGSLGGGLGTARAVIDSRVSQAWHGATTAPQNLRGMAGIGNMGGSGRPVVVPGSTLDQERGLFPDAVQGIFDQRAGARRLS